MKRITFVLILNLLLQYCATAQNCITCSSSFTTLSNGLVFCAPFDGANQNDQGIASFPGNFTGVVVPGADRKGNSNGAFSFNGSNTLIKYGDILDSNFAPASNAKFSISLWGKTAVLPGAGTDAILIGKYSSVATGPFQFYMAQRSDGTIVARVSYNQGNLNNYLEEKTGSVSLGTWFHAVLVFDGTQAFSLNRLKLYVNTTGGSLSSSAGTGATTTTNTTQQLTVGGIYNPSTSAVTNSYNGLVDDVRIYNRAISNAEINELYNGTPLQITNPMPDIGLCFGDSVQLNAQAGGTSYLWTLNTAGLSATNIANPMAKPTSTTTSITYTVTITNGACSNTDNTLVTVNRNCCVLSNSISSKNPGLLYYLPVNNEARDASASTASPIVQGPTTVLAIDRYGNKNSAYSFSDVTNDKLVTTPVPKLSFPINRSFTISAWANARKVRSINSHLLTLYKNGGYEIILTPSTQGSDSCKIQFTDYDGATSTTMVNLKSDSAIKLNQWFHIGITVNRDDSTSKMFINGRLAAQVKAVSSVQNACGLIIGNHNLNPLGFDGSIDEVRVYNYALGSDEITDLYLNGQSSILNPDTTICSSANVQINTIGNSSVYAWAPATWLSDPTISMPVAKPMTNTTYVLTSTNGGCTFRDTVKIFVNYAEANAGVDTLICKGDSVQLVGAGGTSFLWAPAATLSNTGISNPYAKPGANQDYVLKVTTATCSSYDTVQVAVNNVIPDAGSNMDICIGDSIQLNATGGTDYQWSPYNTLSNYQIANPYAKPTDTTTYHVLVTSGFCSNSDSVRINVIKVFPDAGTNRQVCPGDSVQLSASGGTGFAWMKDPALSDTTIFNPYAKPPGTQYFYVYAKVGNCRALDSMQVTVKSSLVADAGSDDEICWGRTSQLNATGGTTFLWTPSKWLDNPNINNPVATPDSSIDYIVYSTSGNCVAYDTMHITVNQLPIVDCGNDTSACMNQPFQLTPRYLNANVFDWTPTAFLDDAKSPFPNATIPTKTEFEVIVKDVRTGCSDSDFIWIDVSTPTAKFTLSALAGDAPFTVTTSNQSIPLPMTYLWTFTDSIEFYSVEKNPSYTFNSPGTYLIQLDATDEFGCTDSDTMSIEVRDVIRFYIPNAFTPNGDHNNETFALVYSTDLVATVEGTIWNKWGQEVFTVKMPGGTWWDGKSSNGNLCPEGVYFYSFKVTDVDNRAKIHKGSITLLR